MRNTGSYLLLTCILVLACGCATTSSTGRVEKGAAKHLSQSKLPKFDIPVVVNDRVVAWLDYFQGPGHSRFAIYLARSGRYTQLMQETLRKYALPQDLVYLAMIESGFSPRAHSRSHADGFWQFIKGTGKRYGLDMNHWVDERRDPEKSTVAAARYLRDLFDRFGDWYLAMAAYNAGEGKIERAIVRNGTRDFWEMIESDHRFLKAETKDYVPKFIAAAIIAKSPDRFGFGDVEYEPSMRFETGVVDSQTDLQVVAKCAGVPLEDVTQLNTELMRGATPPHAKNYEVRLPRGTAGNFKIAYANLAPSEKVMLARHVVKRGESAGKIARRYGVSVRELLAANDLNNVAGVKRGVELIIPTGGAAKERLKDVVAMEEGRPRGKALKHRVKRNETLSVIAQNYDVSVSDLKKWNGIKRSHLRAGQLIKIYGVEVVAKPKSKSTLTYVVRRGDSWWKVAQRYGVSINELKGWNTKLAKKDLTIGQKLKLFATVTKPQTEEAQESVQEARTPESSELMSMDRPQIQSLVSESDLLSLQ